MCLRAASLRRAFAQLQAYFDGALTVFDLLVRFALRKRLQLVAPGALGPHDAAVDEHHRWP